MASKKLLVADDSLTIQKVIRLALANEGYEIQAISDGNDAIQHISLFQPDLVLIDVSLPGKSAFEVKRAINQEADLDHARFILMSSAFERVDEAQAAEVGFHGRLTKPFDPGHLREVLQKVFVQYPASKARHATAKPAAPQTQSPPPIPLLQDDAGPISVPTSVDDPMESLPLTPPGGMDLGLSGNFGTEAGKISSIALESMEVMGETHTPPPIPAMEPLNPEERSSVQPQDRDSDIRQLTEATVRMSGLNDFEWSVQEPSLRPPQEFLQKGELDETSIRYFKDPKPVQESSVAGPHHAPTPPAMPRRPDRNELRGHSPSKAPNVPPAMHPPAPTQQQAQAVPIDAQMIEEIVTQRVEEALARVIQKQIPEIAEKLLKEQIRQMLSEQP